MIQKQYHNMTGDKIRIDKREVCRYLGYAKVKPDETVDGLVEQCIQEMTRVAMPKSMYQIFEIEQETEDQKVLQLGFARVESEKLARNLQGCQKIILLAATLGPRPDLLIQKNSKLNPLKGVVMQAVGAMLIESYVDEQNEALRECFAKEGYRLHPRFSPGYGDFKLEHQSDIFKVLDCSKNLGLTLMDSMIMAPSKSVTAVIGMEQTEQIEEAEQEKEEQDEIDPGIRQQAKCAQCDNTDCAFRTV